MITKFIIDLTKGRFLGHPVHTMLIHFPAALFIFSAIADVLSLYFGNSSISYTAFLTGITGAILGWAAAIFGLIDLLKIDSKSNAFKIALWHGGLNLLWLSVFSVLTGSQIANYPLINIPGISFIIIKLIVVIGLLVSNFLGGQLIYKYKVFEKDNQD
jgi:uncharacterized membrane protein